MKKKACTLALLAALLAVSPLLAAQTVDESRAVSADARVAVESMSGSITVTGWDQLEVRVTGTLGDDVEGLRVEGGPNALEIEVQIPDGRHGRDADFDADLEIRVPRGSRLEIETISAGITVSEIDGSIESESVSGSVKISGRPAEVDVETVSGGIDIAGSGSQMSVESVSGKIRLQGVEGMVEASSVSGDIEVEADSIRVADLESVSGSVTFRGALQQGAELDAEVHSGNVTLILPASTLASFDVETFSGTIENDFGPRAERTDKYVPGMALSFSTGEGAEVQVESFSGRVRLQKQ